MKKEWLRLKEKRPDLKMKFWFGSTHAQRNQAIEERDEEKEMKTMEDGREGAKSEKEEENKIA